MSDTSVPVTPQAEPPAPSEPQTPVTPPPLPATPVPAAVRQKAPVGGSIAAAVVTLLLLDLGVETFLAGSPILWPVMGVEVVALALLALLWTRVGPTIRLTIPLLALVGLVAWAALRLGSWADPALRLATMTLPRIGVAIAILGTVAAAALLFGLGVIRRAWYIGALLALVALSALVPFVRGLLAGSTLVQVMAGAFDWQRLPAWLQGGYLVTQVVLPIGLIAGLAGVVISVVRHARATWTTAGVLIVLGAFVIQSAELTRAGRPHLAGMITAPLLAKLSAVAPPAAASLSPGIGTTTTGGAGIGTPAGRAPAGAVAPQPASSAPVTSAPAGAVLVAQPGEPNDSLTQAKEIRIGDSIEGAFPLQGNDAYFKLVVDKPGKQEIQIDLSSVPGAEAHFRIQGKDKTVLWTADRAPKGAPESVSYFVVTEGVYFVRVWDRSRSTDKYTLSVRLLGPWRENTEAEPNDDFKFASELRLDVPMTGRINKDSDVDYYVLTIPEPGRDILIIQTSGIPREAVDISLYDEKRVVLGETVRGKSGSGEIVRMRVRPGTYYLMVSATREGKRGSEYTLYAGKPPKPPASPAEVQQALVKALGWLAKKQEKNGSWTGRDPAYTGLSLMAFIGGTCVAQDYSANVKRAVEHLKAVYKPSAKYAAGSKEAAIQGGRIGEGDMYHHGIVTLALIEALVDTNDSRLEPIVQDALNLIIRSQNT